MTNFTPTEATRYHRIRNAALRGDRVNPTDKQWVLDLAAKYNIKCPAPAIARATALGYETSKVLVTS